MKKTTISTLSALLGAVAGACTIGKTMMEEIKKARAQSDKHLTLFLMMNQWVKIKQSGKSISEYFEKNDYKRIAIYGMSYAGETLFDELKDTKTEVIYGIDRNADNIYSDLDLVSPEEKLEIVDAVVVTAVFFFDEIEENLSKKLDCPILSLEDILYEI